MASCDSLLPPDENRAMFDRIARRYDLLTAVLSLGLSRLWLARATAELGPQPRRQYLDIGCGTGESALAILRRCPLAAVAGIDPAEGMLAVGRAKIARAGLSRSIRLTRGEAAELGFADGVFAGVLSAYCLRSLPDRAAAFAEIRRVLAPGGRAVLLELTTPRARLIRAAHGPYLRWFAPALGGLLAGSRAAYRYLADSIRAFPPAEVVVGELTAAGLAQATFTPLHGGIATLFAAERPYAQAARAGNTKPGRG